MVYYFLILFTLYFPLYITAMEQNLEDHWNLLRKQAVAGLKEEFDVKVENLSEQEKVNVLTQVISTYSRYQHEQETETRNYLNSRIKDLFQARVDSNMQDEHGQIPLVYAVWDDQAELVSLLLAKGAHVNTQDAEGKTALLHAAHQDYQDIAQILLDAGADVNIQDNDGSTALIECAKFLHYKLAALLIRASACVNTQDNQGKSAIANIPEILKGVPAYNYKQIIERLLNLGQLPEVQAYLKDPLAFAVTHKEQCFTSGITVLMLACIFCHKEVISFYKNCSHTYLNLVDHYGNTAFNYAVYYDNSLATFIYTFGKDIRQLKLKGPTILEGAMKKENVLLIDALLRAGVQCRPFEVAQGTPEASYLKRLPNNLWAELLLFIKRGGMSYIDYVGWQSNMG